MSASRLKRHTIEPVGFMVSPYRQKFGVPRQPGLVRQAVGYVELVPPYDDPAAIEGLAAFSHVWLTFVFHHCLTQGWRRRVRPPRLGGNRSCGVFASRSPFRPNHLGLSAVELLEVETAPAVRLHVRGMDLLDGSPIVDIKPYLPYADALPAAKGGFAAAAPAPSLRVDFAPAAAAAVAGQPELAGLIRSVLALDPRPAYRAGEPARRYGMCLGEAEIAFRVEDGVATVLEIAGRRSPPEPD